MDLKKTERYEQKLLEELQRSPRLGVAEVAELLGISEATARRLFARMEQQGKLIRTYGGVRPASGTYLYEEMEQDSISEKMRIGLYAASLSEPGERIYIDSGTTAAEMCRALARRIAADELPGLTVFTNSLVNLEILAGLCPIHLTGGEYRPDRRDVCGYQAESSVAGLHFSRCFLGADGFDPATLFMATDYQTARLCELVLTRADSRYVLADSHKFARPSFVSYCTGTVPGFTVITDACDKEAAAALLDGGAELIVAPEAR